MKTKTLDVFYHGMQVGTLAETADKRIAFQYSDGWLREGFTISPFSLPLDNKVFLPKDKSRDIFDGLFGVFADSLPDSWGKLLLDRYLVSIGINKDEIGILDRLAYIGASGMGALEYYPSKRADYDNLTSGLDYDRIALECGKLLSSQTSDQLDLLYNIAGSSGGTRPKILISDDDREWIIKFPAGSDPLICGKREYDYSLCAKKCGIDMTETALVPSEFCDGYFKTERFDRRENQKIFTITFSGVLEVDYNTPTCDYATFMKMLRVLTKDNKYDMEQMFKLMCFNVLAHNRDDHTKNFSFVYTDDKRYRLAPAYDLTYSDTYFGEQTTSVGGKGKNITEEDLLKIGEDAGLSKKNLTDQLNEIKNNLSELGEYLKNVDHRRTHILFRDKLSEVMR